MNFIIGIISVFYFLIIYTEERLRIWLPPVQECPKLTIDHAVVFEKYLGDARIQCEATHFLVGHNYIHCSQGKWVEKIPKCISKTPMCNKIEKIPNGMVLLHSKYNNASISFFCNPGYKLKGQKTIYCIQTKWDSYLPQCIKSDQVNTNTSCDFETTDLCGWTQDINHDFDWKRENSKTVTGHIATGPRFDHTFGFNNSGHYMIIEGQKARMGDVARLFSPLFSPQNFTCFEFYYHMYGQGIGTLNIYIKQESTNIDRIKPIWTKFGNQGNKWYRSSAKLTNVTEPFQIIIEAVRGFTFLSNIAIDDVKLLEKCDENESSDSTDSMNVTEKYLPVRDLDLLSCYGRCNVTKQQIGATCQCDSSCYDNNNCCPDYISVCVSVSSGWATDYTTIPSVPAVEQTPQTVETTAKTQVTKKSTITNRPSTAATTPKKVQTTPVKVTKPSTKPTPKIIITPTTVSTQIRKVTTKATKPSTATTKKYKLTTTKPKIIVNTVSASQSIPTESTIAKDLIVWDENDFKIPNACDAKPKILNVFSNDTDKSNTSRAHVQFIVISILVLLALTGIIAILAIKLHKRKSSTHNKQFDESTTDVRYLTSDEVLEFTLATPSKDSDLLLENN